MGDRRLYLNETFICFVLQPPLLIDEYTPITRFFCRPPGRPGPYCIQAMTNARRTTVLTTAEFDAVTSYCFHNHTAPPSRDLRDWIGATNDLDEQWTADALVEAIESAPRAHGDCAGQVPALRRALRKALQVQGEEIEREAADEARHDAVIAETARRCLYMEDLHTALERRLRTGGTDEIVRSYVRRRGPLLLRTDAGDARVLRRAVAVNGPCSMEVLRSCLMEDGLDQPQAHAALRRWTDNPSVRVTEEHRFYVSGQEDPWTAPAKRFTARKAMYELTYNG